VTLDPPRCKVQW